MKPSICRLVVYNHPGSADGKYPPRQSPAVVQVVNPDETVDLFVMSVTGGIFFAKGCSQGDGPSQWNWPAYEPQSKV